VAWPLNQSYWTWISFQAMDLETRLRGWKYVNEDWRSSEYDIIRHNFEACNDNDDAVRFIYDEELERLLRLWIVCGQDDVLTKLSWV
jgi:hypothetical protein